MTQDEAIKAVCRIVGLTFLTGPYEKVGGVSDCFCSDRFGSHRFENDGIAISYVLDAVKEKMIRDGISPEKIEKYLIANPLS